MPAHRFHTVDVFARERYTGNQLAVFHGAGQLDTATMQALTRETNYSEATLVADDTPEDGRYPVRIFDPAEEIPFAGHPTLGTAAVIREFVRADRPDALVLSLGVGDVPVWVEGASDGTERYWMRQIEPAFGDAIADRAGGAGRAATAIDPHAAARVLGLDTSEVLADAPVELVSTGLPTLVVPLRSLAAAERAATQPEAYQRELIDVVGGCNLLIVTGETDGGDADLHVRVFADWAGVAEDPATGSSNGCLAAYLARYERVARQLGLDPAEARGVDAVVEQGIEMGRPSRLYLRASVRKDAADGHPSIDVRVGGRVIPVFAGHVL